MDAISYSYADKQAKRIKKIINDPDSTSGIVTVPKVIASGENITVPAGRVAILPNVQVDGTLNVQGDVFIPSGATLSKVVELDGDQTISDVKTFIKSPIVPTPTNATDAANKAYVDTKANLASPTFTGTVTLPSTTSIGTVSSAELGYLAGVTSAIQTQINGKAATNQTMYIGTTAMAINRATAAQTLTGVSIDGNAATATALSGVVGSAPSYACRAWVNFNGTGTVAIRASGNVSSITDNGVGLYTVNFTTAMPDANYSFTQGVNLTADGDYPITINETASVPKTATALKVILRGKVYGFAEVDTSSVSIQIFR